jgi:hypothetical protein
MSDVPAWRLREELVAHARELIEGRARFERDVRPATKPLPKILIDPHDLLRVLGEEEVSG